MKIAALDLLLLLLLFADREGIVIGFGDVTGLETGMIATASGYDEAPV